MNGANVSGINFAATATSSWSISGTITGATGVTVALSGAATGTTTTDASGNYSFSGLQNGSYTVTPTKTGFTFSPANAAVTVNGANVPGNNFAATAVPTWSISGTITGATGVTVALSGAATGTTTTDASGDYQFPRTSKRQLHGNADENRLHLQPRQCRGDCERCKCSRQDFVATAVPTWTISGTITGATGVTVALSGAATATTTTDASGDYSFAGLQTAATR